MSKLLRKKVNELNKKYKNQLRNTNTHFELDGYNQILLKADTIAILLNENDEPLDLIKFLISIE